VVAALLVVVWPVILFAVTADLQEVKPLVMLQSTRRRNCHTDDVVLQK
jgi:hypothetical protein